MTGVKPAMKRHVRKLGLPVFTVSTFLGAVVFAFLTFHTPAVPAANAASVVQAANFLPQHQAAVVKPQVASAPAESIHPLMVSHPMVPPAPVTYRVRAGDTLSGIAHKLWGHASEWPRLWYANRHKVPNPLTILKGQNLTLPSSHSPTPHMRKMALAAMPQVTIPTTTQTGTGPTITASTLPAGSSSGGGEILSAAQIGALWVREGGSPAAVGVAECIAEHESGGNTHALSPTNDWGLWQINGGGPAMWNAVANAQRAIAMSNNGTNWSPWTTAPDCGV
jgi:LysM repeat protein